MADTAAIPVLDSSALTGAELVAALRSSSCVFLTGLPTLDADLAALLTAARSFFSLPERRKLAVRWSGEGPWQGWQPVYDSGPAASTTRTWTPRCPATAPRRRCAPASTCWPGNAIPTPWSEAAYPRTGSGRSAVRISSSVTHRATSAGNGACTPRTMCVKPACSAASIASRVASGRS